MNAVDSVKFHSTTLPQMRSKMKFQLYLSNAVSAHTKKIVKVLYFKAPNRIGVDK